MIEISKSTEMLVNEEIIRKAIETTLALEVGSRKVEGGSRKSEGGRRKAELKKPSLIPKSEIRNPNSQFPIPNSEVSVLLTDDAEIQRLNKQYRGVGSPTDVLAFAMREGIDSELNPYLLGDIVISIQTAQRQAVDIGHSLDMELAILAVHGTLHLLGYDHEIDSESVVMRDKEEMILRLLYAWELLKNGAGMT